MKSPQSDPVYDTEAAGRYLGGEDKPIARKTLENWQVSETGPEYEDVGGIRYRQSKLDEWGAKRRRRSTTVRLKRQTAAAGFQGRCISWPKRRPLAASRLVSYRPVFRCVRRGLDGSWM